jgi:hypothetical protein
MLVVSLIGLAWFAIIVLPTIVAIFRRDPLESDYADSRLNAHAEASDCSGSLVKA